LIEELLSPFYYFLSHTNEKVIANRVKKGIFKELLTKVSDFFYGEEIDEDQKIEPEKVLSQLDSISTKLLTLASAPSIAQVNRGLLYSTRSPFEYAKKELFY